MYRSRSFDICPSTQFNWMDRCYAFGLVDRAGRLDIAPRDRRAAGGRKMVFVAVVSIVNFISCAEEHRSASNALSKRDITLFPCLPSAYDYTHSPSDQL